MEPSETSSSSNSSPYCLQAYGQTYPSDIPSYIYRPVEYFHSTTEGGALLKEGRVGATLQNGELWKKFAQVGNEMLVTKAGR